MAKDSLGSGQDGPAWQGPSYNREPGSRGVEPRLAAEGVRAMTPVDNTTLAEQRPSGRRWSEQTVESKSMTFWVQYLPWATVVPVEAGNGLVPTRGRRRRPTNGERCGKAAGTVPAARSLAGMPSPIRLRLSPDGREDHVRWGGGGQETGERAMVPGDERLRRKRQGWAPKTCRAVAPRLPATRSARGEGAIMRVTFK